MDMKIVIAVCVVLNFLGVLGSAFYWNRNTKLRILPVVLTTLSGCIYSALNPEISGFLEVAKVVGLSVLIGFGFYFTVWVQCKE